MAQEVFGELNSLSGQK